MYSTCNYIYIVYIYRQRIHTVSDIVLAGVKQNGTYEFTDEKVPVHICSTVARDWNPGCFVAAFHSHSNRPHVFAEELPRPLASQRCKNSRGTFIVYVCI